MSKRSCEEYQEQLMALLDGALDETAQAALESHIESCAACREEYAWIKMAAADLEALGDDIAKKAPQVDLAGAVMQAVARTRDTESQSGDWRSRNARANVVPLIQKPKGGFLRAAAVRFSWAHWTAMAAAAAAILVFCVVGYRISQETRTPEMPTHPVHLVHSVPPVHPVHPVDSVPPINNPPSPIPHPPSPIPNPPSVMAKVDQISLDDIVNLRKESITNPDARLQIARWASLTVEEARDMAESKKASLNAKVGASKALPPPEAQVVLLAAVEADPKNPYYRQELANAYGAQPETAPQEAQQLEALKNLEPGNALAAYKSASNALEQGDVQGALTTLEIARNLPGINLHTRESAVSQEQALVENGVAPDAASLITALTAGSAQYTDILGLSNQLLQFGSDFQQQGNTDVALAIYDAVRQLGTQVAGLSAFSAEQLAGLDVQRAALDVLDALYRALGQTQNTQTVNQQQAQLAASFDSFNAFIALVDSFFSGNTDPALISNAVTDILQNGDIAYFGAQADAPANQGVSSQGAVQ